jgi:hypothetical protein
MSRKLNAHMVVLPALDAEGALLMSKELLTRSKDEGPLPEAIALCAKRLRESRVVLDDAWTARLGKEAVVDDETKRKVSRLLRSRWRAAQDVISGWVEITEEKGGERSRLAKLIQVGMFAGGLRFLRKPARRRWVESERRLKWLEDEGLEAGFIEIGGPVFLEELRDAHRKYGEVHGITENPVPIEGLAPVREPLDDVRMRIREYAMHVTAFASTGTEPDKARASRLLEPLEGWTSSRSKPPVKETAPAPSPAPTPAVTPPHT